MSTQSERQIREFSFSEAFIREGRRIILVLILCSIPSFIVFTMLLGIRIEKALPAVGIACLGAGIIFSIETILINRRQRKLKVFVYEDRLLLAYSHRFMDIGAQL